MNRLEKCLFFSSVSDTGDSEVKIRGTPNWGFLDALPMSYRRLVGGKVPKPGICDKLSTFYILLGLGCQYMLMLNDRNEW